MPIRPLVCPLLVLWLACVAWAGVERIFVPVPLARPLVESGSWVVTEESARRALAMGFTASAAAQAEKLLAEAAPGSPERDRVARLLAAARLELDDPVGAARALEVHSEARPSEYWLRQALIAARLGREGEARRELGWVVPAALPVEERAWYYYLDGLLWEAVRDGARAGAAYEQAEAVASSEWQRARLKLARERLRLLRGEASDGQAESLRLQAERYAGRGLGTDFAIQHAVALHTLGRREAAVAYLQKHLAGLGGAPVLESARDDTRLMLGLIAGPGSPAGRVALEQLLAGGSDVGKQRAALLLLVRGAESVESRESLRRLVARLYSVSPPHRLQEELLLARAELALEDRRFGEAEVAAREALEKFPGSPSRVRALVQLAEAAWEVRRFRSAADYAAQAAAVAGEESSAALRVLAAEALYRAAEDARRNEAPSQPDFIAAAEAYRRAAERPPAGVAVGALFFQEILAWLGGGRLEEAEARLDLLAADPRFDAVSRWRAEWNLVRQLEAAGRREAALARVERLRRSGDVEAQPAELRARMAWLHARLAREAGRVDLALELARSVPGETAGLEPGLAGSVAALASLVEAEALFELGRGEEAVAVLRELRERAPDTEAAMQSFLVEADYQAAAGRLADAQGLLVGFADANPSHPYTPYALFQAALNAERRGEDVYLREAYLLLERMVNTYKQHELVFSARMKQGDLLRRFGEFSAAQVVYESLNAQFGRRAEALRAQLALADSHRAQGSREPSHYDSALTILERLRDLADAPADVRAEASFKIGDLLMVRDGSRGQSAAIAQWSALVDGLVRDRAVFDQLGPRGRYWVGRALLRLAAELDRAGNFAEAQLARDVLVERGLPGAVLAAARVDAAADPNER